jgi:hypothetical protein
MKPYRTINKRLELLKETYLLHGKESAIVAIRFPGEMIMYDYLGSRGFMQIERINENKCKVTVLRAGIDFIKQLDE